MHATHRALLLLVVACGLVPRATAADAAECQREPRRYLTRPDFHPEPFCVAASAASSDSKVLVALRRTGRPPRGQNAAMILSDTGQVLWYLPGPERVYDLKTVTYRGRPHLALHRRTAAGHGHYELRDGRYRVVKRITLGPPYRTDMHELQVTANGTAYIGGYHDVPVRGAGVVTEYVIREIALDTGKVLFEWHSLDHVPLADTYMPRPRDGGAWDYLHGNSIDPPVPGDPTIVVSGRNTSAVYGIDRRTGEVSWRLGGRRDQFGIDAAGARFCAQHDARRLPDGDITVFDNGGHGRAEGPGCPAHPARVLRFRLDVAARTARLVRSLPSRLAGGTGRHLYPTAFGSARLQPDGNTFISWGTTGDVTEVTPTGEVRFALRLASASYRAVRAPWAGMPAGRPRVVARRRPGGSVDVRASWNGATEIAAWQLLAGERPGRVRPVGQPVPFADLETRLRAPAGARYVAVHAFDVRGRVLGRSRAERAG